MSYVVLARKWRPQRFEDLVGQEHVARTLANAIASGRIAHAFLFTGVRGVGKTTSARLLARALNCMGSKRAEGDPDPGPTATPCLECPACREITQGSDVDVREIDGASYNGVDEVRKLQDSLPYRPARDRYKIFIIDEVHMLSQSAWNAFLKTLEEPPPHVKFIFATTEVHKVPVTILSRVQRFDFKMIPTRLIVERLRFVLEAEGVSADEAGLSIIARQAAGSMRDAMSLLDQVIAWNDQRLDGDSVARVLGVASRKILHELAAFIVDGKTGESLNVVERISQQGFDLAHVARDFLELLRDLVVAKVCGESGELLDLPDEEQRDVLALAERANADDLLRLYHGFSAGFDDVLRGTHPRGSLEMLLVRLCRRPPLIPLDDLLLRLSAMERRLGSGAGAPSVGPARRPQTQPSIPVGAMGNAPRPQPREARTNSAARPSAGNADADEDSDPGGEHHHVEPLTRVGTSSPNAPSAVTSRATPPNAPSPNAPSPNAPSPNAPSANAPSPNAPSPNAPSPNAPSPNAPSPNAPSPNAPSPNAPSPNAPSPNAPSPDSPSPNAPRATPHNTPRANLPNVSRGSSKNVDRIDGAPPPPEPDENELIAVWQELVERVMNVRPDVSAVLEHAVLLEANAEHLVVGWPPNSVFSGQFDEGQLAECIRTAQSERGVSVHRVSIVQNDPRALGRDTLASRETAERTRRYRLEQARIRNHPRIKDVQELLAGRVVSVKLADH